jgi:general L-amino acid transport system permease protein
MTSEAGRLPPNPLPHLPPRLSLGAVGWMRKNLFSTWFNSLLTVAAAWIVWAVASDFVSWALLDASFAEGPQACKGSAGACWGFIREMWPLFMVGVYPQPERWRPAVALLIVLVLGAVTLNRRARSHKGFWWLWPVGFAAAFLLIRGSAWIGLSMPETTRWGGLMLTLILTVAGIAVAFPFSIVLALGRRSRMPIIRAICVAYIELIRGVPLITILFMASFMLPLFFPEGLNFDKVLRAQVGIILFSSAYLAEVVRGGLQGVGRGQVEAAGAMGLSYWQTMGLIVMPQALRIVIPPLTGTFIALLKDTSLVAIVGLFDLLGMSQQAVANPRWLGKLVEAYAFVALIYFSLCYGMSHFSRVLERRFKVGQ